MPRTSNTPERDDEGRFVGGNEGAQMSSRDYDDDNRSPRGGGQGRGWHGDSEGHAEAGSHSHDNSQGTSRSQSSDDDRRSNGGNRQRDDEGRYASGSRGASHDDEADYGNWHAYGHARGYHGYQRRGQSTGQGQGWHGDSQGHAEAGSRNHDNDRGGSRSRSYDDDTNYGNRGGNRQRDDEGRYTGGNRH